MQVFIWVTWCMKNSLPLAWLYFTAPEQRIVAIPYIEGMKLLHKVIGIWQNVWHNGEGSSAQV